MIGLENCRRLSGPTPGTKADDASVVGVDSRDVVSGERRYRVVPTDNCT